MKKNPFTTKFLDNLLQNFSRPEKRNSSLCKEVASAIEKTLKGIPANQKLPSVRQIAAKLDISLVSAHNALRQLLDKELVYSKEKSGIFIKDKTQIFFDRNSTRSFFDTAGVIRFATDSSEHWQKELWKDISSSFYSRNLKMETEIDYEFALNYDKPGTKFPDCLELSEWTLNSRTPSKPFMELDDFLIAIGLKDATTIMKTLLPIYHRGYFFFFNKEQMEKKKLPLPEYTDYIQQKAYLKELSLFAPKTPIVSLLTSRINPSNFSTRFFHLFMEYLKTETEDIFMELLRYTREISTCRMNIYNSQHLKDCPQRLLNSFTSGELPFFIGESGNTWQLLYANQDFDFDIVPLLGPENICITNVICGAVSKFTHRPVESLKFLAHLLAPESQQKLAGAGFIDCAGKNYVLLKEGSCGQKILKRGFNTDYNEYTYDPLVHYVKFCIFNNEIINSLSNGERPEKTISMVAMLSKAFLNSSCRENFSHLSREQN